MKGFTHLEVKMMGPFAVPTKLVFVCLYETYIGTWWFSTFPSNTEEKYLEAHSATQGQYLYPEEVHSACYISGTIVPQSAFE